MFNYLRGLKIIDQAIKKLKLDLTGKTILTELGTNSFLFMPLIPAMANAKKVYAWSLNIDENTKTFCLDKAKKLGLENNIEIFINEKPNYTISEADIITNSFPIRPLNKEFLKKTKSGCVIPLMFESWEKRNEDIDFDYCIENNIKVAGTCEDFKSIGPLCIKLALNAEYEIYQNNIIIWSDDSFGYEAYRAFKNFGAKRVILTKDINYIYNNFTDIDFLFICDYQEKRSYDMILDFKKLKEINNLFGVVHLIGDINPNKFKEYKINLYPNNQGYSKKMTKTLDYLGLNPVLNLQVSSFKVAQNMLENKQSILNQPITYKGE
jgi:hypothetical protein